MNKEYDYVTCKFSSSFLLRCHGKAQHFAGSATGISTAMHETWRTGLHGLRIRGKVLGNIRGTLGALDHIGRPQHFLQHIRCLPQAWWLLNTDALFDMPARTPPIPSPLLIALIGKALSKKQYGQAAALALCFAVVLRTYTCCKCNFATPHFFRDGVGLVPPSVLSVIV